MKIMSHPLSGVVSRSDPKTNHASPHVCASHLTTVVYQLISLTASTKNLH